MIGRAMTDIQAMSGRFDAPLTEGEVSVLTGTAPAAGMQGYQTELTAYSGGRGRLSGVIGFLRAWGRIPCGMAGCGAVYAPGKRVS